MKSSKSTIYFTGSKYRSCRARAVDEDISEGRLFHGQAINYRKDGSEFMMEWKIVPIRNQKEEITQYLAIQRDLGDQYIN